MDQNRFQSQVIITIGQFVTIQTCVIEMGSNKFLLETTPNKLQITMVEGKNLEQSFSYEVDSTKSVYIGRYHESEISIIDDNTLSFIHAKLSQIGSVWYFDDMNSTNGSWLRLDKSQLITHGLIFKLGNANVQYKCQLSNYILNNKNNIKCLICSK